MNLTQLIIDARKAYRQSGQIVTMPEQIHVSNPDTARPSSMDNCPLKHAYEKQDTAPDFEGLVANNNPNTSWIMDHGTKVAEMVQLPLLWYGQNTLGWDVEIEREVYDPILKVSGRIDGIVRWHGNQPQSYDEELIVEIKNAEGKEYRSIGEPRLSYCLQTLCYMMLTGIHEGAIVIVSKWGFHVYYLREVDEGRFILVDEQGMKWRSKWGDQWNDPDNLNFTEVQSQLSELHAYMRKVQDREPIKPPIEDPLNNSAKGWLCGRAVKGKTAGTLYVSCPFAERCHGWTRTELDIEKIGSKWQVIPPSF